MAATYLVTGGAGFIGSALVRRLLETEPGAGVVVLDALGYGGARENLAGVSAELVVGDIRDRPFVRSLLDRCRPRALFHLAAETHVDRSIEDGAPFVATNVAGTLDLYEAVRASGRPELEKIVHVSTDEVLGPTPAGARFTEDAPIRASSPYAASKAGGEALAQAFFTTYGLPITIARPTNHYGPRQLAEKLIPLVICRALLDEPLPVYGDGLHRRDWLFVDDGCDALLAICRRGEPGRAYHVGSGIEHTTLEVVHAVCDALGSLRPDLPDRSSLVTHVEDRPGHDRRYSIDTHRIETELGWRATTRLSEGLRKTVKHYLDPAVLERAKAHLARRGLAARGRQT